MNEYTSAIVFEVGLHKLSPSASMTHLSKLAHLFAETPTDEQLQLDQLIYAVDRVQPVDDQTPEFSSRAALDSYLSAAKLVPSSADLPNAAKARNP